jgi:hypothetical protein
MSEATPKSNIAVEIKIDPDALTIGDMAFIMAVGEMKQSEAMPKMIEMMNRVVIGGVNHFPASRLGDVMGEVVRQWGEAANPKAQTA